MYHINHAILQYEMLNYYSATLQFVLCWNECCQQACDSMCCSAKVAFNSLEKRAHLTFRNVMRISEDGHLTIEAMMEGHHGRRKIHESAESAPRDGMCATLQAENRLKSREVALVWNEGKEGNEIVELLVSQV